MRRTLSTLGGLALGIALSQFPEYAQQYVQRLGGAVDELRIIVEDFDRDAASAGLTRDEALGRYAGSADAFIIDRGTSMAATLARYDQLSAMLVRVERAEGWERFALLPDYLDTEIGARALEAFKPAVPVTPEGFAYAGGGFLAGYMLLSTLVRFLMLPFRPRRRRQRPAAEEAAALVPPPVPSETVPPRSHPALAAPAPAATPEPQVALPSPERPSAPDPEAVRQAVMELTGRRPPPKRI